ncbi:MAG: leucine-rich repeat protein [Treponema sp.]|nr:leucine-rich repeat protein [Treponema sp.]
MADYSVSYTELDSLLAGLPANTEQTPYDIEITEVTPEFLAGSGSQILPNTLQSVLYNNSSKSVVLTWGASASSVIEGMSSAEYMFAYGYALVGVDLTPMKNITAAQRMFDGAHIISADLSPMVSLSDATSMLRNCSRLTSVDTTGLRRVKFASYMFFGCSALDSITIHDMESVTKTNYMFGSCSSLSYADISSMHGITDGSYMFSGCVELMQVDLPDMPDLGKAENMFELCLKLPTITLRDIASNEWNAPNLRGMFQNCRALRDIHGWALPAAGDYWGMFTGCSTLSAIYTEEEIPAPQESSWHAWDIKKDTANNQSTVTVYNPDGTSNSVSVPSAGTYTMKVTDKVDELLFSPSESISAATIQKMLQTKAPITAKDALDPTEDNFMLWAKDRSSARTNVTTDVIEAGNKLPPTSEAVQAAIGEIIPLVKQLGAIESFPVGVGSANAVTIPKDGFILCSFSRGDFTSSNICPSIIVNGFTFGIGSSDSTASYTVSRATTTIPVITGDVVYLDQSQGVTVYARFYENME